MTQKYYDHLGQHWRVRDPRTEGELTITGPHLWLTLPEFQITDEMVFSALQSGNYRYLWRGSHGWTVSVEHKHDYNEGLMKSFDIVFSHENSSRTNLMNVSEQMCRDLVEMLGGSFATAKASPAQELSQDETMTDISEDMLGQLQAQLGKAVSLQDVQTVVNRAWKLAQIGSLNMQLGLFMTSLGLAELGAERNCPNLQTLGAAAAAAEERIDPAALRAPRLLLEEYRTAKASGQQVRVWP